MTVLDIGVIVITVAFVVRGGWIGLVRQLAFFIALTMGYMSAGKYYPFFAKHIVQWVSDSQLRFIITYTLLFFCTYVLVMLLGLGLKKVMQISFLGWFDTLTGGLFGLVKAAFVSTLLYMLLAGIFSSTSPMIHKSFFSPYLMVSSEFLTTFIKDKKLKSDLLPKKPAISSFLSDPVPVLKTLRGDSK